ncbi:MAG TPA: DUF1549 domain-containing protein [Bryobacteraceae bacterium]|nr:DUF1549 domain-containing protein [Bryobacteraceae bacterium]
MVPPSRRAADPELNDIAQSVTRSGTTPVPLINYIDRYVFDRIEKDKIPHAGLSTDEEFLRRIYLDLTGRLPEPDVIQKFLADHTPGKRTKVIDELMATPESGRSTKLETPFLSRWTYFFCDLFEVSVPHMERGRTPFADYIHLVLLDNVPYDRWVTELLTAKGRSNWLDGPMNFLTAQEVDDFNDRLTNQEDTDDAIAIATGKLFLGVNMECVSCHDGKGHLEKINVGLSHITRDQLWRQAAFFSKLDFKKPYSINQEFSILPDRAGYDVTSHSVQRMPRYKADVTPQFFLSGERPRPGEDWQAAFARMLTASPQFARATVNLFWTELMGVGIVDPPFSFDLARQDPANPPAKPWTIQPANPELLDALAKDFRDHHFDLRYLIRTIVTSSTYQLSSHFDGEWKVAYEPYFARHHVRRLDPEMIADAISQATGVFNEMDVMYSDRKVSYVMDTYGPEDVRGKSVGPLGSFLHLMGQGYRVSPEKDNSGSMVEASALLNSRFVRDRVKISEKGRLHDLLTHTPPLSNDDIVDQVFLAFLGRHPSPKEKTLAIQALEQRHGQGLEDLAWSLINMPQFLLNY